MAGAYLALHTFIATAFDRHSLEQFVKGLFDEECNRKPEEVTAVLASDKVSFSEYVADVLTKLRQEGLVDHDFFVRLANAKPRRSNEVRQIAAKHDVVLELPRPAPAGPAPSRRFTAALASAVAMSWAAAFAVVSNAPTPPPPLGLVLPDSEVDATPVPYPARVPDVLPLDPASAGTSASEVPITSTPAPSTSPGRTLPKPGARPTRPPKQGLTHLFKGPSSLVHESTIEFVFTPPAPGMYSIRATGTWTSDYSTNPADHVVLKVCDLADATQKCKELESSRLGTHTDSPHHSLRIERPVRIVLANPHSFDMSISDVRMHVKQIA